MLQEQSAGFSQMLKCYRKQSERNIEGSVTSDIKAYTLAKTIQSHKGKVEVKHQFGELQKLDGANAYVRDLGTVIGGEA